MHICSTTPESKIVQTEKSIAFASEAHFGRTYSISKGRHSSSVDKEEPKLEARSTLSSSRKRCKVEENHCTKGVKISGRM